MDTNLSDISSNVVSKINGYGSNKAKSSLLTKQQTTEIYEEDEEYKEYVEDDHYENYDNTSKSSIITSTQPTNSTSVPSSTVATTIDNYNSNSSYSTYPTNQPYYNYQYDCFDEEDELVYLENEREEEAEEEDVEEEDVAEEEEDEYGDQLEELQDSSKSKMLNKKPKHLIAQDSIDDNEFFRQHSKNMLTISKQESIQEEDETIQTPIDEMGYPVGNSTKGKDLDGSALAGVGTEGSDKADEEKKKEETGISATRKSEITAKQRWNWAYNKIIMQLNVSTISNLFICQRKMQVYS